jgi:DNA-binding IclR family transcriptional regulator
VPGLHREAGEDDMKHAASILSLLSANPEGLGVAEISIALGASLSASKAQLHQLMLAGIVRATRPGRGARWFICESVE